MPALLVRHKVADFEIWKAVFDEHGTTREANGSLGGRVFQSNFDPNEVFILLDWDDPDRVDLFVRSDDLSESMVRAGVTDRPDVWMLKEVDRTTS